MMIRNKMPIRADKMPAYHIIAQEIYRHLKRNGVVTVRNRRLSVQAICTIIYDMDRLRYVQHGVHRFSTDNAVGDYNGTNLLAVAIGQLTYMGTTTGSEATAISNCLSYLNGEA